MIYKNNHQLSAWLTEDHKVASVIGARHFYFKDEEFADALQHVHVANKFTDEQARLRAAHKLIMEGKFVADVPIFTKRPASHWLNLAWKIAVIVLLAVIAARAEPQPIYVRVGKAVLALPADPPQFGGIVIQLQNAGSTLANRGGGLVTFNCSTNLSCSFSGTTFTMTGTGGAGTGCVPPGGSGLLLYDDGAGGCANVTKFSSNGTTTLTGAATAILDLSAAATFKPPQATAPTVEGTSAFNTTTHLPVWGFNGASTATIPKTLANASHKWLNSYDQTTGTLTQTQPACTDLSDSAGGCTMSTTAGGDLSGTLPSPTVAKVNGNTPGNTCTNQFTRSIDSSARGSCATVANADMANTATTVNGQTCTLGSSCTIPLSAVNPETATYQVLAADFSNYKTITVASGTFTITLVASGSQPAAGQYIQIINYGSGVVTVARSGQNINGAAGNFTLSAGSATAPTSAYVISDATNYFAQIDEGTVGTVTSAIVAGTANQVTVTGTCTITTTGTCTLSLPAAVILGTDNSVAGTLQLANGGAAAHTIYSSGATTTNTIAGFTAVPTTLDLLTCTSSGTTCTLTDAGFLASNAVRKDTTNTAATGMTLDMSAATGATALKVPVIAGATAGADGVIDYDSTAKITHVRTNAADSLVAATTGTSTTTTQVLHATAVAGVYSASAVVDADIPAAITRTIANGTSAMGTGAISSGACATVVTTSATGTATTDNIMADFNADPTGVTGYVPASTGILTIIKYPTANNVNFKVCNLTASSITPGAITLNWRVTR